MSPWSRWVGVGAALGIISALVPVVRGNVAVDTPAGPLARLQKKVFSKPVDPNLAGLDLLNLDIRPERVLAQLPDGRQAELTVDSKLQRTALAEMSRFKMPESGTILMDVRTGRILIYASYVNSGKPFDVNVRAEAPAASIFKVITGAALIERSGLNASTRQCYHGGRSRILAKELLEDPGRDKWCASLGEAMGRSINVVFGRLSHQHLKPEDLTEMGGAFGFGAPVPFAVPNQAPQIEMPTEPLEFARASAGFWHTRLSPLAAVGIAQTVASRGVTLQPRIVARVLSGSEETLWEDDGKPKVLRRAVKPATAAELAQMMEFTVSGGSAHGSFFDQHGHPYLPGIAVAGKTGTLTDHTEDRHYTWFIGFAPAENPEVAVAVLVVNTPSWKVKAPTLARDALRAYFAQAGRPGVSSPI